MRDLLSWRLCTKDAEAFFLTEIYNMDMSAEQEGLVLWELWYLMLSLIYWLIPSHIKSKTLRDSVLRSLNAVREDYISRTGEFFVPIVRSRLDCYPKAFKHENPLEATVRLFRHYVDMIALRSKYDSDLKEFLRLCPPLDAIVSWLPSWHIQMKVAQMVEAIIADINRFFKGLKIHD